MKFSAVAFDLDGTLYPAYRLNYRLIPFLIKKQRLVRAMGRARSQLRKADCDSGGASAAAEGDFYELQAQIMGEVLGRPLEEVREETERLIYRGWEPAFKKIGLFPHVKETLDIFRSEGIPLGLLSDFPPEIKLENLGIAGYWETVICSEATGRLKPDPEPFLELARCMGMPAEKILYVGNSVSYDVAGAHRAGMKAALIKTRFIQPGWTSRLAKNDAARTPDFVFNDYRQLSKYVLN